MSAKALLDTNILVYTFDGHDLAKRETARTMVGSALRDRTAIISHQVIQEFLNVATRKFATPLTEADSALYLKQVLNPLCEVHSSIDLYKDALDIQEITPEIADLSVNFDSEINNDPADRLIAATAILSNAPIITADQNLRKATMIKTIW